MNSESDPTGIYVHIPFCLSRCSYCAFVSNIYDPMLEPRYVQSLIKEINLRSDPSLPVDTIYFGGGTPSLFSPSSISSVIDAISDCFGLVSNPEITLEANPATVDLEKLREFKCIGINRLSLGVQSFFDSDLKRLGRRHSAEDTKTSYAWVRKAGFQNVSIDLMAGYPGQSMESLRQNLALVGNLEAEHLSIYLLEVKEGTDLYLAIETGSMEPPDPDKAAEMYELICGSAETMGLVQYEISNFARPGFESKHNLKYWSDCLYIGIGSGAHGMLGDCRYENIGDIERYSRATENMSLPVSGSIKLDKMSRLKDALIMGARLNRGLDLRRLSIRYDLDVRSYVLQSLEHLLNTGLFEIDHNDIFRLTSRGRLLSNVVFENWL